MATVDLTAPAPPPLHLLDGLPRRVTMTLPELQLVAELAGRAPLPFDLVTADAPSELEGRLGASRELTDATAYARVLAGLADPRESLTRRGLLQGGAADPGLGGAVGLLATPRVALDLDVLVGGTQARAWHRQAGGAVAALATVDGAAFELAWFHTRQWPDELARVPVLPADLDVGSSALPAVLGLPFALAEAATDALATGRPDLLPVLVARHSGSVSADGTPLDDGDVVAVLTALHAEARGRLRALVAGVAGDAGPVGVVAWTLLADGWHSVTAVPGEQTDRVEVRRVEPAGLPTALAPALAEAMA